MDKKTRVVIVGAGFAGFSTFRNLKKQLGRCHDIELILVNTRNYFLFTPLLHEVATGALAPENIIEPLRPQFAGIRADLVLGEVSAVSLDRKVITVGSHEIAYSYLVLAPGSQTNFFDVPGAKEYAFELKTLEDALKIKNQIIENFERALHSDDSSIRKALLHFVVIGGGPTGVELAAELADFVRTTFRFYYPQALLAEFKLTLVHRDAELLPMFSPLVRIRSLATLRAKGVEVRLNTSVTNLEAKSVTLMDGTKLKAETIIWAAGVKPCSVVFDRAVDTDRGGRIVVNEYLQLPTDESVYVIGDLACVLDWRSTKPLPALAQVAVRQARVVAANIYCQMTRRPLKRFYYHPTVSLVSVGEGQAASDIWKFHLWGRLVWFLWRLAYWSKIRSFPKQLQILLDWGIGFWEPRDISDYYESSSRKVINH